MTRRPTLPLKSSSAPSEAGNDALADLLDQPSGVDPFHPQMATKPSKTVIPDQERLAAIVSVLVGHATGEQRVSPQIADQAVGEASQLLRNIGNAASNRGIDG